MHELILRNTFYIFDLDNNKAMFVEVVTSVLFIWLLWYVIKTYLESRKMPPGPFPLPFIGNIHQIGTNPPFTMDALCDKYGDVLTLTFPVGTVVMVNSGKLAKEALVTRRNDFSGRPIIDLFPLNVILEGRDILTSEYGPLFMFRRKLFKTALHVFGGGVNIVEERLNSAVQEFLDQIQAMDSRAFNIKDYVTATITSQLWEWLSSRKYHYGDQKLKSIIDFNETSVAVSNQGNLYQLFPLLRYLPTKYMQTVKEVLTMREEIFGTELEYHRQTYQEGVVRDVIDAFIANYEREKAKGTSKDLGSIDDIKFLMIDVMAGGSDTSISFISWFILYMAVKKEIQEKLHEELHQIVGEDRLPILEDVKNLPYLQAVVCEVMRMTSFIPLLIPHKTIRDTTLNGYHVPRKTTVFINQYRIHNNPKEWNEPKLFKPERFLDADGKFVGWTTTPAFLPFGFGHRACPGQDLGKMQVFLILSSLFHQFKLEMVDGEPVPSLVGDTAPGSIRCPKDYKVIARKRI